MEPRCGVEAYRPATRVYSAEPTLEAVYEMEHLLLSKAEPGCSRRLFDGLWKRWCIRAYKSETPWASAPSLMAVSAGSIRRFCAVLVRIPGTMFLR